MVGGLLLGSGEEAVARLQRLHPAHGSAKHSGLCKEKGSIGCQGRHRLSPCQMRAGRCVPREEERSCGARLPACPSSLQCSHRRNITSEDRCKTSNGRAVKLGGEREAPPARPAGGPPALPARRAPHEHAGGVVQHAVLEVADVVVKAGRQLRQRRGDGRGVAAAARLLHLLADERALAAQLRRERGGGSRAGANGSNGGSEGGVVWVAAG